MTPRERMFAALEGREVDRCPVFAPYIHLSNSDHWHEVTGKSTADFYRWNSLLSDQYAEGFEQFYEQMPFDVFEQLNESYVPRVDREVVEIIEKDDGVYRHNKSNDTWSGLSNDIHNAGESANETRLVHTREDIDREIVVVPADEQIRNGSMDHLKACVDRFQDRYFILGCGIVNSFYGCTYYVGFINRMTMYLEEPEFIEYVSERYLERNLERIRAVAKTGADAMWIDDATATADMISLEMYERFSLPYLKPLVREIQRLGMKCILIYFGSIADRVEQILSTKPDGLVMEASMKGYANDIEKIARQVSGRTCLFGNLNPYEHVQRLSDGDLAALMKRQYEAVKPYGPFVCSTGSPITPGTPVSRIRYYIDTGHSLK